MAEDGQSNCIESKENFIRRLSSLLAITSTCDIFYNVYQTTKDKYAVVASVLEISEGGIKRTTALARKTMQPVLQKLQPQIAGANDYACKGLDHLEAKFPVLHQDATKIACDVKEMAIRRMKSIRDEVASSILHVSDKAAHVVTCSLEKTKVLVNGSVTSALSSKIGRSLTHGADAALSTSEELVDSYLPREVENRTVHEDLPNEEAINSSKLPDRNCTWMYFLTSKLYTHASKHVVMFIQNAKKHKQEIVTLVPDVCFMGTPDKENLDIASSNSKVQAPISRCHNDNKGDDQKEDGTAEPTVPYCFSDIVTSLKEISNAVQMNRQQVFETLQTFHSQLWSINLAVSLENCISQIRGKLWDAWNTLRARKDDVLSHLTSNLLLLGIPPKEDEMKHETEENKSQGWQSLVPRPPKEQEVMQISEGKPGLQITQGREVESIPNDKVIITTLTGGEGGRSALLSSGQSEKEGRCLESEIPGDQLQEDLNQHIAQMPVFPEQQGEDFRESGLGHPIPF
ncbi:perilipin-2-like isoform X1 [Scyliorhinus canicula]|uniref:perilipin-2-like isoform X1 n=1 Tax=Scyliorhinus canicula TaxID=7830 RepID=UPI0018F5BF16|nr:perilipin-2-like isoform X1 [Scyliorhinus canicula]XP_038669529.1 perilipin-2-like isoform X1 [Scyliorhinus canicula]XP_038669530.1 perilipin-2-like isoform X1 [Scyliorhinus canicula]